MIEFETTKTIKIYIEYAYTTALNLFTCMYNLSNANRLILGIIQPESPNVI